MGRRRGQARALPVAETIPAPKGPSPFGDAAVVHVVAITRGKQSAMVPHRLVIPRDVAERCLVESRQEDLPQVTVMRAGHMLDEIMADLRSGKSSLQKEKDTK